MEKNPPIITPLSVIPPNQPSTGVAEAEVPQEDGLEFPLGPAESPPRPSSFFLGAAPPRAGSQKRSWLRSCDDANR